MSPDTIDAIEAAMSVVYTAGEGYVVTLNRNDREFYQQFKRFMLAGGGEWNKRKQLHYFPDDPKWLIEYHRKHGYLPDHNPLDFFETPNDILKILGQQINDNGDLARFGYPDAERNQNFRILEPSAGNGAIAGLFSNRMEFVELVELHEHRAKELASYGFNVSQCDFLDWNPNPESEYRLIVANPPFDKGAWRNHFQKMLQVCHRYGVIYCILPASAVDPSLNTSEVFSARWFKAHCDVTPLPQAFKGTTVKTVLIRLDKHVIQSIHQRADENALSAMEYDLECAMTDPAIFKFALEAAKDAGSKRFPEDKVKKVNRFLDELTKQYGLAIVLSFEEVERFVNTYANYKG